MKDNDLLLYFKYFFFFFYIFKSPFDPPLLYSPNRKYHHVIPLAQPLRSKNHWLINERYIVNSDGRIPAG